MKQQQEYEKSEQGFLSTMIFILVLMLVSMGDALIISRESSLFGEFAWVVLGLMVLTTMCRIYASITARAESEDAGGDI